MVLHFLSILFRLFVLFLHIVIIHVIDSLNLLDVKSKTTPSLYWQMSQPTTTPPHGQCFSSHLIVHFKHLFCNCMSSHRHKQACNTIWNQLPMKIKSSENTVTFHLKNPQNVFVWNCFPTIHFQQFPTPLMTLVCARLRLRQMIEIVVYLNLNFQRYRCCKSVTIIYSLTHTLIPSYMNKS